MVGCSCTRVCWQELPLPGLIVRENDSPAPRGVRGCAQLLPSLWGCTFKFYAAVFYVLFVAPKLNCTGLVVESWEGMAVTGRCVIPTTEMHPRTQGHHGRKCLWSYKTFQCSEPLCVSLSLGLSSTKDESMFILKFSRMQMSSIAFSQFSKFIYTMKLNCTDLSKFIRNWFNFPLQGSYAPSCELIKSAPWTISVLANQLLYFQSLFKSVTYFKSW